MTEELYVETENGLEKLDLNIPSGITLNYKSNLFGDLSKITCSHSYTFNLPMTVRNRRILDFAEDIRHQSSMIRKRLSASYSQNGVNLFSNANLYVDSVNGSYKAVLTWDVISGMQVLTDDDVSLCELANDGAEASFGSVDADDGESVKFDNNASVLYPMYNCGIPYFLWSAPSDNYISSDGHRVSYSNYSQYSSYVCTRKAEQRC